MQELRAPGSTSLQTPVRYFPQGLHPLKRPRLIPARGAVEVRGERVAIKMMLEGSIQESGVIGGHGTMSIELGMYGDNVPFVDAAEKAQEALAKLQVDNQEHLFEFVPVSSESMGCQAVSPRVLDHADPEGITGDMTTDSEGAFADEPGE